MIKSSPTLLAAAVVTELGGFMFSIFFPLLSHYSFLNIFLQGEQLILEWTVHWSYDFSLNTAVPNGTAGVEKLQ